MPNHIWIDLARDADIGIEARYAHFSYLIGVTAAPDKSHTSEVL
ncbi:hypothetical protein [Pseudomonas farris]|nr:hypothetical protein [Pseudomonas farris]